MWTLTTRRCEGTVPQTSIVNRLFLSRGRPMIPPVYVRNRPSPEITFPIKTGFCRLYRLIHVQDRVAVLRSDREPAPKYLASIQAFANPGGVTLRQEARRTDPPVTPICGAPSNGDRKLPCQNRVVKYPNPPGRVDCRGRLCLSPGGDSYCYILVG
jgi:hypothetical protein